MNGLAFRALMQAETVAPTTTMRLVTVIEPKDRGDLTNATLHNRSRLVDRLRNDGALLFRGFGPPAPTDLRAFLAALSLEPSDDYDFGLTRRTKIGDRIFSSTDMSRYVFIPPHTEMAYAVKRPSWIAFHCLQAPRRQGETPCFDTGRAFLALPEALRERLLNSDVTYRRFLRSRNGKLGSSRTIAETFGSEDPVRVREMAHDLGVKVTWTGRSKLETRTDTPPVVHHPNTGELCLNMALTDPAALTYLLDRYPFRYSRPQRAALGSLFWLSNVSGLSTYHQHVSVHGRAFTNEETRALCDALFANMTTFRWQDGDILLLDNIKVAHGRMPFTGPRKIAACFGDPYSVDALGNAQGTGQSP